jgi:hypothetical protein
MLEAVNTDPVFTISLKRSTPNLQLSTSRRPITPSMPPIATKNGEPGEATKAREVEEESCCANDKRP